MQYKIKGKNKVRLTSNEFKASGGEGSIYVIGDVAYKIYSDPKKMIPVDKINELKVLTSPYIVKPEDVLLDDTDTPVGYTMANVNNALVLCQIFTKSFRERNNIQHANMLELVQHMQHTLDMCHKQDILIVDLNEMNFLVDSAFKNVYFIDVDSYQTKHFRATALMESVRDRHNPTFSKETDWFSFGITTFQMFVGIHPYKGKHDSYTTLDARMVNNISVFNKDVRIPNATYPLDIIPSAYKQWYKAVFEDGKRLPPPSSAVAVIFVPSSKNYINSNDNFVIIEKYDLEGDIVGHYHGHTITTQAIYKSGSKIYPCDGRGYVCVTKKQQHSIYVKLDNDNISLFDMTSKYKIPDEIPSKSMMVYNNDIFYINKDMLMSLSIVENNNLASKYTVTQRAMCYISEHASKMFRGVLFQSLLGTFYMTLMNDAEKCHELKISELNGYSIIDACRDMNVVIAIGAKNGVYDKIIIRVSDDYTAYDIRKVDDVQMFDINFTVLSNGICLHINENEELEVFSAKVYASSLKIIKDNTIDSQCTLFKNESKVVFAKDNKLFDFSMK